MSDAIEIHISDMPTYVVDTSVIVQWFEGVNEVHIKKAIQVLEDLQNGKIHILIPDPLILELLNALFIGKQCTVEEANLAVKIIFDSTISIVEITFPVAALTTILMKQYKLTSYDAYFLALARYEGCRLISDDERAHGKITDGSVVMLEEYQSP